METSELRAAIHDFERENHHAILLESDTDITVDDFQKDTHIHYHLIPPTPEWLSSRILWGPSIQGALPEWSRFIADALMRIDPNMLICLNRVCILGAESDIEQICGMMNADIDGFPDKIDFEDSQYLGCLWSMETSIVINCHAILTGILENKADFFNGAKTLEQEFWLTLLHEIRHLGLNCNPLLPEDEYPDEFTSEDMVEEWAGDTYGHLFPSVGREANSAHGIGITFTVEDEEDVLDR